MSTNIPDITERFPQLWDRVSAWDAAYLAANARYDYSLVLELKNLVLDAYKWGQETGKEEAIKANCSKAGSKASASKAVSSAQNGRLGGRPRKDKQA